MFQKKLEIADVLNIDSCEVDNILKYIQNAKELEPQINNIFYELKRFCEENKIKFNRLTISSICEAFTNSNNVSFKQYFKNTVKKLNIFNELLNFPSFKFLLLLGYFKHGFNSFKQHLYSYFDKVN